MEGCQICNAKQRRRVSYGSKMLCGECFNEYRMMFDGIVSNKSRRKIEHAKKYANENPLFKSFETGWQTHEIEEGLPRKEIPQFMKDAYDKLWAIESDRWKKMVDERRIDGISENP